LQQKKKRKEKENPVEENAEKKTSYSEKKNSPLKRDITVIRKTPRKKDERAS
jgi:hypothetical protein